MTKNQHRTTWFTWFLIVAMFVVTLAPMSALATAPAEKDGAAAAAPSIPWQKYIRSQPNPMPPADDFVIEQMLRADGKLTLNSTAAEAKAAVEAIKANLNRQKGLSGPNPIAYAKRLAAWNQAEKLGKSPMAAGLGEIGEAKLLMAIVEFAGSQTFDNYQTVDGECVLDGTTTTIAGPLHNQIPDPAPTGDNNTLWVPDFTTSYYQNLFFGEGPTAGVGVVRPDLNGGAGVDLTGHTATNWYLKQSEGLYHLTGDFYGWVQLPVSEGEYGADEPCTSGSNMNRNGPVFRVAADTADAINAAYPGFDWSEWDTDDDGIVDHYMIAHAGVGNEAGGGAEGEFSIWAHSWDVYEDTYGDGSTFGHLVAGMDTPDDRSDDIRVFNYTIVPEDADIGVIVHEYGHDIGLPDYYDTSGAAENSTAFWDVMSAGSWTGELGGADPVSFNPWARTFFGWTNPLVVDYDLAQPMDVMLGQAAGTPAGAEDTVRVNLPPTIVNVPNKAGDGKGWHNELGDNRDQTATRSWDLSGVTGSLVFSFDTYLDLEADYDYGYFLVSTDNGSTWASLQDMDGVAVTDPPGGLNDHYEGALRFDISAYAGLSNVITRFRQMSDGGVQWEGWWIDNLSVTNDATVIYSNDLEDSSDWTLSGFEIVPIDVNIEHYYMLEWRNLGGFGADSGLAYGYQTLTHPGGGWIVDRVTANVPGMVVWYRDDTYTNNNVLAGGRAANSPAYGPKGSTLVVDANADPLLWSGGFWNPATNARQPQMNGRRQSMDAAFGLATTNTWNIHDYANIANAVIALGNRPAKPAFHDSMSYVPGFAWPGNGFVYTIANASSVVIPASGNYTTRIRGLAADGVNLNGDFTDLWGATVSGNELGSGNPGDSHTQYGLHFEVMDQAADGSYGQVKIWNAATEVEAMITVTPDTFAVGQTATVAVSNVNNGGAETGLLHVVGIDRSLVSYVDGSVYGGAFPISVPDGVAAQMFKTGGAAALKNAYSPDSGVVAIAYVGDMAAGQEVNFGFDVMAELGAAGGNWSFVDNVYKMGELIASASASFSVPALNSYEFTLQDGLNGYSGTSDTFLNAWMPTMAYGGDADFYVRQPGVKTALVKFDLSAMPGSAQMTQAQIGLYVTYGSGNPVTLEAYQVYKAWSEMAATWNDADAGMPWEMPGAMGPSDRAASFADRVSFGGSGRWVWFDVTDLAQMWVMNADSNQGIALAGTGNTNSELEFTSSDYIVTFVRPQMKIIFQAP
ncbi:MAG: M6 family metalloprotease domain-containing protein [Anaerolineae bacterium]